MRKYLFTCLAVAGFHCAVAQYHFYYGNIHAHTAYSDGTKDNAFATPATAYQYAKSSYHMDFLGIAEHNHYSFNNSPGMHIADYGKGLYQADTSNANGDFVCLFGMEYGVIDNGGHLIIYGIPGLIGWESGSGNWGAANNYDIYNGKYNYETLWNTINSYPNAFATMAHPQDNDFGNLLEGIRDTSGDNAIVGCAIRSGDAFSQTTNYSDDPATLYQNKYFMALKKGYHLGPTIDHDNHYTTFGRTSHSRTVVLAQALDRDSIMAAYKAMRFYASDDWDAEVTFLVNNHVMGESDTTGGTTQITISIADIANNSGDQDPTGTIELYYGRPGSSSWPSILATNSGSDTLSYTHTTNDQDSFYYFAKITQVDGDMIWTAPVWMKTISEGPTGTGLAPAFVHAKKLKAYPNPASDQINLELEAEKEGMVTVRIYNFLGRQVYELAKFIHRGDNKITVGIGDLVPGMYTVVVSEKDGRLAETRFIKY